MQHENGTVKENSQKLLFWQLQILVLIFQDLKCNSTNKHLVMRAVKYKKKVSFKHYTLGEENLQHLWDSFNANSAAYLTAPNIMTFRMSCDWISIISPLSHCPNIRRGDVQPFVTCHHFYRGISFSFLSTPLPLTFPEQLSCWIKGLQATHAMANVLSTSVIQLHWLPGFLLQ